MTQGVQKQGLALWQCFANKRSLSSGNDVDRTKRLVFSLLGPSLLDEGCALGSALNRCCCSRSALARAFIPTWCSEEVRVRFLRCPWCRSTRLMTPHQHGTHVCRGCGHTIMSENPAFRCTCHHCAGHLKIGKSGPQEIPAVGRPTVYLRCPESSVV
jgi:hypothetical protein